MAGQALPHVCADYPARCARRGIHHLIFSERPALSGGGASTSSQQKACRDNTHPHRALFAGMPSRQLTTHSSDRLCVCTFPGRTLLHTAWAGNFYHTFLLFMHLGHTHTAASPPHTCRAGTPAPQHFLTSSLFSTAPPLCTPPVLGLPRSTASPTYHTGRLGLPDRTRRTLGSDAIRVWWQCSVPVPLPLPAWTSFSPFRHPSTRRTALFAAATVAALDGDCLLKVSWQHTLIPRTRLLPFTHAHSLDYFYRRTKDINTPTIHSSCRSDARMTFIYHDAHSSVRAWAVVGTGDTLWLATCLSNISVCLAATPTKRQVGIGREERRSLTHLPSTFCTPPPRAEGRTNGRLAGKGPLVTCLTGATLGTRFFLRQR